MFLSQFFSWNGIFHFKIDFGLFKMVKWTTMVMIRKKTFCFSWTWYFSFLFFSVKQVISCLPKSYNLKTPALVLHSHAYLRLSGLEYRNKVSFPDAFRIDPSNAAEVIPGCRALLKGGSELYTSGNSRHSMCKPLLSRWNTWSRKRSCYFYNRIFVQYQVNLCSGRGRGQVGDGFSLSLV